MKTKFIQVRCGPEDKKRARVGAARRDKQLSAYIRELIRERGLVGTGGGTRNEHE